MRRGAGNAGRFSDYLGGFGETGLSFAAMNETLMAIVEEFAAFLTLNKEDELKPDAAAWGMMRLREHLSKLSQTDRATLIAYLESSATDSDGDYAVFAASLPEALGLRGERNDA